MTAVDWAALLDIVCSKSKLALIQHHAEQFTPPRKIALADICLAKARALCTKHEDDLIHEGQEA